MKKTYYYWFSLLLLLATTSGWAQTFTPILERGVYRPGSEVSGAANLTVSGNYLYFVGRNGDTGPEVWRTDGTPSGTKLVKDITPGPVYGYNAPTSLFDMNGTLYFFSGQSLYKTDGTEAGTVLIREFGDIGGANLLSYNGLVIFIVENGLWRTDGTPGGTYRIDKRPSFTPRVYNGLMYYTSSSGPTFQETDIIRSDGTVAGTSLVRQIPGTLQSFGIGIDGFYLNTLTGSSRLWTTWKSDGTTAGTVPTGPSTTTSQPGYFNAFGDLYQRQNEVGLVPTRRQNKSTGEFELVTPTPNLEVLQRGVQYNGQIYGNAYTPATGQELSRLDGSPVRDLNPGSATGILLLPVVANGLLYFTGNDGTTGFELWQSDGSANGTRLTGDLLPGRSSYPLDLTVYKGDLYFDTWDGTLYKLNPEQTPPPPVTPPTQPTGALAFSTPSYDCNTGQLTVTTTGGNGSLIEYRVIGLRDWSTSASFDVPTWQRSVTTFTLDIRQSGQVLSQSFTTSCTPTTPPSNPTPPTDPTPLPTPPTTGGTLSITAPAYDCSNGQLTVQTTGGSGSLIEYRVIGLRDWSASNRFDVPTWQRSGTPFTLDVRQDGQVISRSFTSKCDRARVSAPEKGQTLGVILYPNPVTEQFTVEVNGMAGQTVHFDVVNLNGRSMIKQSRQVDADGHIERLTMPADATSGLYLLRVSDEKQTKTIKVVKQ